VRDTGRYREREKSIQVGTERDLREIQVGTAREIQVGTERDTGRYRERYR
jgi:hypothetical protein